MKENLSTSLSDIHDGVDSGIITTWEEIEKSTETPDEDEDVEETDSDEKTE